MMGGADIRRIQVDLLGVIPFSIFQEVFQDFARSPLAVT